MPKRAVNEISISTPYIELQQLLKFAGLVDEGGEAKMLIKSGAVKVNGEVDLRRGRKIRPGDEVEFEETLIRVVDAAS